jgi:HK97 family phage portal protein
MIETLGTLYKQAGYEFPAIPAIHARNETPITGIVPGTLAFESLTGGTPTYTGRLINPNVAMTYTAVWAAVKILSEGESSIELRTYRNLSPDGLVRRLAVEDYRYRLLREQPNEEMTSMQWREFMMASLLLWGNSYNLLDWDARGRVRAIWPLRPDWVVPLRNTNLRRTYRYQPLLPYAIPVEAGVYEDWQILHIPGLGWDGWLGYSPIAMMRNAVALGLAQEEQGGRFVAGGGTQKVALVSAATIKDPEEVRKEWRKTYGGMENTGQVAVLHGGLDVKTFGIPPKDAQFLEGRTFQLSEVARMYNVPPGMLHDVMSKPETYASAEQADLRFVKHSLRPWCVRIEQKVNTTVLDSNDELTCKHDLTDLYRGDLLSQAQGYNQLVGAGLMTRNEGRARLDLDRNDNPAADELTVQMQVVPLGTEPAEPGEPATEPPQK